MMTEETEKEYKLGSAVTGRAGRRQDDCPVFWVMGWCASFSLLWKSGSWTGEQTRSSKYGWSMGGYACEGLVVGRSVRLG